VIAFVVVLTSARRVAWFHALDPRVERLVRCKIGGAKYPLANFPTSNDEPADTM
jgi:hypothetical protein